MAKKRSKRQRMLSVPGGRYAYTWANAWFFKVFNITSYNIFNMMTTIMYVAEYHGVAFLLVFFAAFLNANFFF